MQLEWNFTSIAQSVGRLLPPRYYRFVPKRFRKYLPQQQSQRIAKWLIALGCVLVVLGMILFTGIETLLYARSLENFELRAAQVHARRALPFAQVASALTLREIPDIEAWRTALLLSDQLDEIESLSATLSQTLAQTPESASFSNFIPPLLQVAARLEELETQINDSLLARRIISAEKQAQLHQANQVLAQLQPLTTSLFTGKQTWVVVFQNSDELRATGGFAGSYALITLQDGALAEIVVEDIYDADGQFSGYLAAPPGMSEYTSSSRGLRLPDANWFPHFPQSAQTMLQFFAFGKKHNINGIITVNLPVAEAILRLTGPLPIPDYNTAITAENVHQVLRDERGEFFPGSIQKKHILSQAMTVLRQQLTQLPREKQLAVFSELVAHATRKEIQAYALNPDVQQILSNYGLTGEVGFSTQQQRQYQSLCDHTCQSEATILYLVESNVGINKANRFIVRTVTIQEQSDQLQLVLEFHNTAPKTTATLLSPVVGIQDKPIARIAANGYANYQRLLISPTYSLQSVTLNGEAVTKIDTDQVIVQNRPLNQYGFLAIVLPEETATITLHLASTSPGTHLSQHALLIQKQSGLPPTPYTLQLPQLQTSFVLEQDRLITW